MNSTSRATGGASKRISCGATTRPKVVLAIAALTSGVSLLEVITSVLIDEYKMSRRRAVLWSSLPIAGLGTLCVLSVANWDRLSWIAAGLGTVFHKIPGSFFDLLDVVSSSWILPLSGLAISLSRIAPAELERMKKAALEAKRGSLPGIKRVVQGPLYNSRLAKPRLP